MSVAALLLFLAAAQAETPVERTPPNLCTCKEQVGDMRTLPDGAVIFTGVPFDALVTLDASGLNPEPRQATIFRVLKVELGEKTKEAKVWHNANLKQCGIQFDYGKVYRVRAKKLADALETDHCLMKDVAQPGME